MARPNAPCPVPGCKGSLEAGKREGRTVEWCRVCERRIPQLQALHARLSEVSGTASPRATAGDISDAQLLTLVEQRCIPQLAAAKVSGHSLNTVMEAARAGQIPMVRFGRVLLFGRASLKAWGKTWVRKPIVSKATREIVAVLPRREDAAISEVELVSRAKRTTPAVQQWCAKNLRNPQLRRVPALNDKGRAVTLFWWQEANGA